MQWKTPKNTDKYIWTEHVAIKMRQYGLSEQKVLGVIRRPKRIETGIATDTVAVMQPAGTIKYGSGKKSTFASTKQPSPREESWKQEIWILYKIKQQQSTSNTQQKFEGNEALRKLQESISNNKKITIISAWRYPGVAPERDPIPSEIMREIEEMGIVK